MFQKNTDMSLASAQEVPDQSHINDQEIVIDNYPYTSDDAVEIKIGGRTVWHVTSSQSKWARIENGKFILNWPYPLKDRFDGLVKVSVNKDGQEIVQGKFQVGDNTDEFNLVDLKSGEDQIIDKWGRLSKTLSMVDPKVVDSLMRETQKLEKYVKETTGLELFSIGGTLLGIIRGGKILPGDDDVDLSYMSKYENPSDIALESYELERALRAGGYDLIRYSAAHVQIYFPAFEVDYEFYIDILAYFNINENFYGTAHVFEPRKEVQVLPLKRGTLNGYDLPIPYDSRAVLKAIYGPGWEVPDESFAFVTPHRVMRRYYFWLDHMVDDMENWEKNHRIEIGKDDKSKFEFPEEKTDFAQFTLGHIAQDATVVDLGAGLSDDADLFSAAGHDVIAVDYSRPANRWRDENSPDNVKTATLNMGNIRDVAELAKILSGVDGKIVLYGKNWWESLTWPMWVKIMPLIRQLLIKNQQEPGSVETFFETRLKVPAYEEARYKNFGFYHRFSIEELRGHFLRFGIQMNLLEGTSQKSQTEPDKTVRYSISLESPLL